MQLQFSSIPLIIHFVFVFSNFKARSKLPKRRRRVLPVEQPRRKPIPQMPGAVNRRMNALKHQHVTTTNTHPAIFKDAFGSAKIGRFMSWILFLY